MFRCCCFLATVMALCPLATAQGTKEDYSRASKIRGTLSQQLTHDRVEPHWSAEGDMFWFDGNLGQGKSEIVLIDAKAGSRKVIDAPEREKVFGKTVDKKGKDSARERPDQRPRRPRRAVTEGAKSPDGKWVVQVREHDVYLVSESDKKEHRLTKDGKSKDGYNGQFYWSPDSQHLIAIRFVPGGDRKVTLVESSPKDRLQPKTEQLDYLKPGDPIPQSFPHLFDIAQMREIALDNTLFNNPWDIRFEQWEEDSSRFLFVYNQRGHTVVRLIAIDAKTGKVTALIREEPKTFVDYNHKLWLDRARDGSFLWMSERSGFNRIHRFDAKTGADLGMFPNDKGSPDLVVRSVEKFDHEKGELTLRVLGLNPKEDPYHVHYLRVKADGTGQTVLTKGDGTHRLRYSPDGRYYLDTWSRADLPPVTELRKSEDGSLVCKVEEGNADGMKKAGWTPPERFVAKGRDGKTDIYGLIHRPTNFDPKRKYPVIEHIYAGPHDHHVPKAFVAGTYEQPLTELGFIVVKIDGMGTNWRSKGFHDVCWKNLGDSGFPDRVLWIREAAKSHPEMDLSKGVGIFGGSAGGQSAVRAMTEYPDFYTVGVSDCGCHDNRMDKIWWNELWMSWPIGDHYKAQSNVTNAHKIKGKLLLVVGELDKNVDPASTLQVANALIKADKDFEMLLVPGGGHGIAESPYGSRKRMDHFVRHLLGVEPRR